MKRLAFNPLAPAAVTLLLAILMLTVMLASLGWEPLALARLGTRFSSGQASGSTGYDGQFVYYIARDPDPQRVAGYLDVPAYRYQRILLPLLARLLAWGSLPAIPWALMLLGLLAQATGAWAVSELLHGWGVSRWYALIYGLWVGFLLALAADLPEPIAYALVALAWLARTKGRPLLSALLFGLALLAKEVTILFVAAAWLFDLKCQDWRSFWGISLAAFLPFAAFQAWLFWQFGQLGLASGGDMATPFEWIPFMGLWRIRLFSWRYMLVMLIIFAPSILLPVIWGIWRTLRDFFLGEYDEVTLALFFNCLAIVVLPFSTFREPGGLLRFACGLVLALLLFASRNDLRKVLNYCWLWLVLNVFLLKT